MTYCPRRCSPTSTLRARACLRTFVSASCAMRNSSASIRNGSWSFGSAWTRTVMPVSDVNERASAASASASGRPASGVARRSSTDRRASSRFSRAIASALSSRSRACSGATLHSMHGAFDVERDRGQPLRQRVVDLARDARPLFRARQARRVLRQPGALDGDPDLIRDRRQQPQLVRRSASATRVR